MVLVTVSLLEPFRAAEMLISQLYGNDNLHTSMDDFTKRMANDLASGYYDTVLTPLPVSLVCEADPMMLIRLVGQFVLFAFFILSEFGIGRQRASADLPDKAKGDAIPTGILFFLTLIAKLM